MLPNSNIADRVEDCGNGYGWSVIHWFDDSFYGNCYELAVLKNREIFYDSDITTDVVRGDWKKIEELKQKIRELK